MRKNHSGFGTVRFLLLAAAVLALAACATGSKSGKAETNSYDRLMTEAENQVLAGRVDAAHISFNLAAQADPTRKEPWVRNAQLYFDSANYGRAIVAAQEVLQRDPDDLIADSVLTVSGFRVAAQSLQRLQGRGAIASSTARKEAQQLAEVMQATMGESLAPAAAPAAKPTRRRASTAARPKPAEPATPPSPRTPESTSAPANPFDKLGGN